MDLGLSKGQVRHPCRICGGDTLGVAVLLVRICYQVFQKFMAFPMLPGKAFDIIFALLQLPSVISMQVDQVAEVVQAELH